MFGILSANQYLILLVCKLHSMRKRFLQTHPYPSARKLFSPMSRNPALCFHFSHRILTRTPHRSIKPLRLLFSVQHCCIHVVYTSLPSFCPQPLIQHSLDPALKPNLKLMIAICLTLQHNIQ